MWWNTWNTRHEQEYIHCLSKWLFFSSSSFLSFFFFFRDELSTWYKQRDGTLCREESNTHTHKKLSKLETLERIARSSFTKGLTLTQCNFLCVIVPLDFGDNKIFWFEWGGDFFPLQSSSWGSSERCRRGSFRDALDYSFSADKWNRVEQQKGGKKQNNTSKTHQPLSLGPLKNVFFCQHIAMVSRVFIEQ